MINGNSHYQQSSAFKVVSNSSTNDIGTFFCYQITKLSPLNHQNYVILLIDGVRELIPMEHIRRTQKSTPLTFLSHLG